MVDKIRIQPISQALWFIALIAAPCAAHAQSVNAGEVSATAQYVPGETQLKKTNTLLTKKKIFKSSQSTAVVSKEQIQTLGPATGSSQMLSLAAGVNVRGYSNSGTARYEIALRGAKVGWSSTSGDAERNGITVLFDGIPMNNLISHNGQWDSNEIPISQMISGVNVIYGPGNPASRWFDSIGGTVNYVPVQPTTKPSYEIGGLIGSYVTAGGHFIANTGLHNGWSAILAGGYLSNHTFWQGTSVGHYGSPSQSSAFYGKLTKVFSNGSISFGGYSDNNVENAPRPNFLPETPIAGLTVTGNPGSPLLSQQTTGFYGTGVPSIWYKRLQVRDYLVYSKLSLDITPDMTFHNNIWYRHGHRVHDRVTNYGSNSTSPTNSEWYTPTTDTMGDKMYINWRLPYNNVKYGVSAIYQRYNSPYLGYNQSIPGDTQANPAGIQNFNLNNLYLTGFLQDGIHPFKGVTITPGIAGVQYYTQFVNNISLTDPANQDLAPNAAKTFDYAEPSLALRYQPVSWASLYGSFALTYQNPTDNAFGANQSAPVDLGSLKPIQSRDYEVGFKLLSDNIPVINSASLNVNYYQDTLTDETIATYLSVVNQYKFATASAKLQGVNIAGNVTPNFNWNAFGSINLSNNRYTSFLPAGYTTPLHNIPVAYNPNVTFNLGLDYRRFVGQTLVTVGFLDQFTGSQNFFNNLTDQPSTQKLPSFNVANLSLSADIPVPHPLNQAVKILNVAFNVTNLFGSQYNANGYITSGGYFGGNSAGAVLVQPGAPREFIGSITAKF